jgi:hypothetical protein
MIGAALAALAPSGGAVDFLAMFVVTRDND